MSYTIVVYQQFVDIVILQAYLVILHSTLTISAFKNTGGEPELIVV